jgi:hypothetical protein
MEIEGQLNLHEHRLLADTIQMPQGNVPCVSLP